MARDFFWRYWKLNSPLNCVGCVLKPKMKFAITHRWKYGASCNFIYSMHGLESYMPHQNGQKYKNTWNWDKFETNEQRHLAKSVFFGSVPNALRWASERASMQSVHCIVDGAFNGRSIVSEQKSEWMSESEPMSVKWSEVAWYRARNHWCTKVESITPLTAQIKCRKMKQFHCRNLINPMKYFIIFSSHAENIMFRQQTECQSVRQQRTGIVYVCICM